MYDIKEKYSGSILPVTKGICVFCCIPWTDEPRIPVCAGDRILVTRWRKSVLTFLTIELQDPTHKHIEMWLKNSKNITEKTYH